MITKSTVLVLGAGASKAYGFPIGQKLKEDICELANSNDIIWKHIIVESKIPGKIIDLPVVALQKGEQFYRKGYNILDRATDKIPYIGSKPLLGGATPAPAKEAEATPPPPPQAGGQEFRAAA